MKGRYLLGVIGVLFVASGCGSPRSAPATVTLVDLRDSVEPMRTRFNQDRHRARFVAILSPT